MHAIHTVCPGWVPMGIKVMVPLVGILLMCMALASVPKDHTVRFCAMIAIRAATYAMYIAWSDFVVSESVCLVGWDKIWSVASPLLHAALVCVLWWGLGGGGTSVPERVRALVFELVVVVLAETVQYAVTRNAPGVAFAVGVACGPYLWAAQSFLVEWLLGQLLGVCAVDPRLSLSVYLTIAVRVESQASSSFGSKYLLARLECLHLYAVMPTWMQVVRCSSTFDLITIRWYILGTFAAIAQLHFLLSDEAWNEARNLVELVIAIAFCLCNRKERACKNQDTLLDTFLRVVSALEITATILYLCGAEAITLSRLAQRYVDGMFILTVWSFGLGGPPREQWDRWVAAAA